MTRRALLVVACALAVLAAAGVPAGQQRPADHVLVISIDGFRPAMYPDLSREGLHLPHLTALRAGGSAAEGALVSHPSMTYPSHTSLASGTSPARHGLVSHTMFDPPVGSTRWYCESGDSVLVATTRRGAHGFLPTETRMHTGFIASGAGIRQGVPLPLVRQVDIGPSIARPLGFEIPSADGVPMVGVLQ